MWKLGAHHVLWGALADAARTPSRAEADVRFNRYVVPAGALWTGSPLTEVRVIAKDNLESERLFAHELGYRWNPDGSVGLDVAAFQNHYTRLQTSQFDTPFVEVSPEPAHMVMPA